jgi:hypothetical protein
MNAPVQTMFGTKGQETYNVFDQELASESRPLPTAPNLRDVLY